jgi:hypothetical protein
MDNQTVRPSFLSSYFKSLSKSVDERGWRAVFPFWAILSFGVGAGSAYLIPAKFWDEAQLGGTECVYVGILTLNALVTALCWSAFSRVHECIVADKFGAYLMDAGLLNDYILYIDFVQVAQIGAVLSSVGALIVLIIQRQNIIYDRVSIAVMIGLSLYAIKAATDVVTVMHDLIWQKAIYDRHSQEVDEKNDRVIRIKKD